MLFEITNLSYKFCDNIAKLQNDEIPQIAKFAVFACSRHIYLDVSFHAHPVRGELHLQRHVNREFATKDSRITQKWLFIAQYKADVTL